MFLKSSKSTEYRSSRTVVVRFQCAFILRILEKFCSIPGVSSLYSTEIMCLQKTTSSDFCIFTFVESNNSNFGIQYHMVAWQSNVTLSKRLLSRVLLRLAEMGDAANFGFLCASFESVFLLKTTEKRKINKRHAAACLI